MIDELPNEEWRDVVGFPGYRVSNMGRVWSDKSNKILTQYDNYGYCLVHIRRDNNTFSRRVHRLVAGAFLGDGGDLFVNHIDGNRKNNHVDNLEWVTPRENALHSVWELDNGHTTLRDEMLSNEEKKEIITMYISGARVQDILDKFDISSGKYQSIVKPPKRNIQWKEKPLPLLENEEIKLIDGYEYYYISNLGNVYSMKYGKRLSQYRQGAGYLTVTLYKSSKGSRNLVHRLVAEAFVENPNNKGYVDHINGCKTDNRAVNLRWVTRRENLSTAMISRRKVTPDDVGMIRRMNELGLATREISDIIGVSKTTVLRVIKDTENYTEQSSDISSVPKPKPKNIHSSDQGNAAFSREEAIEVNRLYCEEHVTMKDLAKMFYVGVGTIHRIIHRQGAYKDL